MGYKLKEVRELKEMTQDDLAIKSGVSRTIINGLETGRVTNTTKDTLDKIAKALDESISDIFFND